MAPYWWPPVEQHGAYQYQWLPAPPTAHAGNSDTPGASSAADLSTGRKHQLEDDGDLPKTGEWAASALAACRGSFQHQKEGLSNAV